MKMKAQYQKLGDSTTLVLKRKRTALNACIRKGERSQINGLSVYLKHHVKRNKVNPE